MSRLRSKLRRSFPPPSRVSLRDDDGIVGVVVSPDFRGVDDVDRMGMIWRAIDGSLSPEEERRIAIIAAVTPEEDTARSSAESW